MHDIVGDCIWLDSDFPFFADLILILILLQTISGKKDSILV